jgi:hypothetical protein
MELFIGIEGGGLVKFGYNIWHGLNAIEKLTSLFGKQRGRSSHVAIFILDLSLDRYWNLIEELAYFLN